MEEFLSENEDTRKEAVKQLHETFNSSPNELLSQIPILLATLDKSDDSFVALQIASVISDLLTINPNEVVANFSYVLESVDKLTGNDLASDEDLLTSATIRLLTPIQDTLKSEEYLMKAFPILIKLMGKQSSVKWSAYSPISAILMSNPIIAADYTADLLEVISEFPQLLMIIPNLYSSKPEVFRSKIDILMNLYQKHPDHQSSIIQIMGNITSEEPNLMIPYIDNLLPGLNSPIISYQVMTILATIAGTEPLKIYPFLSLIKQGVVIQPATMIEGANVLSLIARVSDTHGKEILPILFEWLSLGTPVAKPLILAEIRNVLDTNKELLSSYMQIIKGYAEDPQEAIRDQAVLIVDIFEGRDIHSLADKIEEQNGKISEIVQSLDDLRTYVDENIDMLKDFIAEVAKKLPIPITFTTEGRIRKTLLLHFVCHTQTDRCLYPENRAFTSETKVINRWLKIAFSAVKIGKAIILPPSAGDAIKSVKEAYDAYKDKGDEDFLDFIKQPFLTSSEQDSLIDQLREASFFNVFVYDSRDSDWNCIMCKSE